MLRIGTATIGQTPRLDVVPAMQQIFTVPVEVIERGALDGLSGAEIAALAPDPGEGAIITRLTDGSSVLLSHRKILPRMQRCCDELVAAGCNPLVMLCGADWSELRSPALIVNPGKLFPATITALAHGRRLGIIKPEAGQIERERHRYAELGIDAVVTSANPYLGERSVDEARRVGEALAAAGVDLVWMTCVGMSEAMRRQVALATGKPVVLAQALLGRLVNELVVGLAASGDAAPAAVAGQRR